MGDGGERKDRLFEVDTEKIGKRGIGRGGVEKGRERAKNDQTSRRQFIMVGIS